MENATQALFIAATVIIFTIIVSFTVITFRTFSSFSESYDIRMSELEIQKLNAQFSEYEKIPKQDEKMVYYNFNTIADVISAVNKAYNRNAKRDYDFDTGVQVTISGLEAYDNKYNNEILGITPVYQKKFHDDRSIVDKNCIYLLNDVSDWTQKCTNCSR